MLHISETAFRSSRYDADNSVSCRVGKAEIAGRIMIGGARLSKQL